MMNADAARIASALWSRQMPGTDGSYEVSLVQAVGEAAHALDRIADTLTRIADVMEQQS